MKTEELTQIGLTKEQVEKVFEMNGKDLTAAKEATKTELQPTIDGLNTQLTTAKEAIKKFDGVDVDKLTKQVQDLNAQMAAQDKDFKQQIAERDFNSILEKSITTAGGRNAKAVTAMLDLDALKTSKNQKDDITAAIEAVKKDNDYLFESKEPIKNPTGPTDNGGAGKGNSFSIDVQKMEAARRVMGLPDKKEGDKK
jgi:uncharacterized coiled-coil protein SlyX